MGGKATNDGRSLQRGVVEAITGIIGGIIFNAVLASSAQQKLIPTEMVLLLTLGGLLSSLVLMFSLKTTGVVFTLGWIAGALILKDLLSPIDFVVYIVAPIAALVIRGVWLFKESNG